VLKETLKKLLNWSNKTIANELNRIWYDDGVAFRVVDGYDVDCKCGFELPSIFLRAIKSAVEGVVGLVIDLLNLPGNAPKKSSETIETLLLSIPDQHKDQFAQIYSDAEAMYRLRDERALYGSSWPVGIFRRFLEL
jgi:hypothetical protein